MLLRSVNAKDSCRTGFRDGGLETPWLGEATVLDLLSLSLSPTSLDLNYF